MENRERVASCSGGAFSFLYNEYRSRIVRHRVLQRALARFGIDRFPSYAKIKEESRSHS